MHTGGQRVVAKVIISFRGLTKQLIRGSNKTLYLKTNFVYYHVMKCGLLPLWYKSDPSVKFADVLKTHSRATVNVGRITLFF
jgi:hypothetical protein